LDIFGGVCGGKRYKKNPPSELEGFKEEEKGI